MTTAPGFRAPVHRPSGPGPRPLRIASAPERQADHARRDHIAAAAERAFVRHGFHAATMQQVAEEAGMSAGNLYRYFPSKEALVEGICMLDQRERGAAFTPSPPAATCSACSRRCCATTCSTSRATRR